jgi:hypothetical protein
MNSDESIYTLDGGSVKDHSNWGQSIQHKPPKKKHRLAIFCMNALVWFMRRIGYTVTIKSAQ